MNNKGKYASAWDDYRKRRKRLYIFFLPLCIAAVGLFALGLAVGPPLANGGKVLLFCALWLFLVADCIRTSLFRCPRCNRFFYWSWYNNSFARCCTHCGLPKWSEDDIPSE